MSLALQLIRQRITNKFNVNLLKKCNHLNWNNSRCILTDSYICNSVWKERLSKEPLSAVKMGDFYVDLNKKLLYDHYIDAIDLDMFANNITKEDHIYELEDLLFRFRRTPNTISIMPSTPHAVIRSYLEFNKLAELLNILSDRNSYGIFPDTFTYNLIFDKFLTSKDYHGATKIATLMMLQEDTGNKISQILAIYSCHKYLKEITPPVYIEKEEIVEEVDEDEMEWVRVHFIRNKFYDDHFDIKDETLLIGKTLWMFGKTLKGNIGTSYQLLGLAMYQKWERVISLLDEISKSGEKIFENSISLFKKYLNEAENAKDYSDVILNKLDDIKSSNQILEENMDLEVEKMLEQLTQLELEYDGTQSKIYESWHEVRVKELKYQMKQYVKTEKIKKIKDTKKQLKDEEDLLFFFENLDQWKKQLPEEVEVVSSKSSKYDENYVVPEMPHPGFKN